MEWILSAALLMGLLGSLHCIGMCGGIVGALVMRLPITHWTGLLPYLLAYNIGRLTSYVIAGMLAGWLGSQFGGFLPQPQLVGKTIAGLFMIALGFYISGWSTFLIQKVEKVGNILWRYLQPLSKRFFPVSNPFQALGIGLIWGWLPCGLVYSALALALASPNAFEGGLVMLAFGVGTLPMLLLIGATAHKLLNFIKLPIIRQIAGSLIIVFGLFTIFLPANVIHLYNNLFCTTP
jgi:sulfite exporter TauE/SafE